MVDDLCLADCELVALAAHRLNQNGEMQLATTGYLECIGVFRILDAQADIGIQLAEETLTQMTGGDEFTFLTGKRAVIDDEIHRDRRLGDLLEWNRLRSVNRTDRISDMQIRDTGNRYDGTDGSGLYIHLIQAVKLIELADFYFIFFGRIVVVYDNHILVDGDSTAVDLSDTDPADILIVVDRADQHLRRAVLITFRSRDVVQNCLKERNHVLWLIIQVAGRVAALCGSKDERAVELLVGGVQIDEQLQYLVDDLIRTCLRTVDFIDTYDDRQIQLQRLAQHKFGLRHSALKCVDHKDYAIYHFQDTFYLAAEICVARCVDDVDFCILIKYCCIFGKNRDTSFALQIIRIHDALRDLLIGTENAALLQQLIDQRRLAVVDMRDNCYVSYIFSLHIACTLSFSSYYYNPLSTCVPDTV